MMDDLQEEECAAEAESEAKRKKAEKIACDRASKAEDRVRNACRKLLSGRAKGDAARIAIADVCALIKWRGGSVPENTSKSNKDALVVAWEAVQPTMEELRTKAASAPAASPATGKSMNKQSSRKKKKKVVDSSDEEEDEEEERSDDEEDENDQQATCNREDDEGERKDENTDSDDSSDDDDDDDDDEAEAEEGEDEETYDVKCIHAQRGKGKTLMYHVEWEGYEERTWEPAAYLHGTIALEEWNENKEA
ncbi:hypothetical protein AB1Y20_014489 [Prymnesium parvum]|uniref:Chromo domain-containing protein n=2 Tax=Prymnesium parvum TaxID=97485 RepID=A0AB34IH70_PRYPA